MSSNLIHGEVYWIQHYAVKCVIDLWQVDGFLLVLRFPPPKNPDRNDITKILLKVVLNTITLTHYQDTIRNLYDKTFGYEMLWIRLHIALLFNKAWIWMIWFSLVRFMVFNATFNNISVISWQSVLLVEETRVPWENHRPIGNQWRTI